MFIKKDLLIRKYFYKNELRLLFLKKVRKNKKNTTFFQNTAYLFESVDKPFFNVSRYRNFCTFTRKPRAVTRSLKVSFLFLRENLGKFLFTGMKKSSW